MKVCLISPYADISSIGIRTISSYLKANGFKTRLVFLPQQKYFYTRDEFNAYDDNVVDNLVKLIKDDDLIGISFMSNFYPAIKNLTEELKIKMPGKPIIWGGIHSTVRPEQCLNTVDYICVGEGETSCLELCQKLSRGEATDSIPGIWTKVGGNIYKNNPESVVLDLDKLPAPDYDLNDNYILVDRKDIISLDMSNMRQFLGSTYWTMLTRGCPFSCTYCCNDALRMLHKDYTKTRSKSPENLIRELLAIQKKFPYVRYINFTDDTLFALSEQAIKDFAECYKKNIDIAFMVPGINPLVFTEKKFDYLVDAGLLKVRMGIQTGSQKVLDIYKRKQDNEKVVEISKNLQKYSKKLTAPTYDIIVDNPWETKGDIIKTIRLLSRLKAPFSLNIFSLLFYPGTRLYAQGVEAGLISEDSDYKHYNRYEPSYLNLIIVLYSIFKVPGWLLKIFMSNKLVYTEKKFPILHNILYEIMLYRRGISGLLNRDYSMFPIKLQTIFCTILPPKKLKKYY